MITKHIITLTVFLYSGSLPQMDVIPMPTVPKKQESGMAYVRADHYPYQSHESWPFIPMIR